MRPARARAQNRSELGGRAVARKTQGGSLGFARRTAESKVYWIAGKRESGPAVFQKSLSVSFCWEIHGRPAAASVRGLGGSGRPRRRGAFVGLRRAGQRAPAACRVRHQHDLFDLFGTQPQNARPAGLILERRDDLHVRHLRAPVRLRVSQAPLHAHAAGGRVGGQARLQGRAGQHSAARGRRRPSRRVRLHDRHPQRDPLCPAPGLCQGLRGKAPRPDLGPRTGRGPFESPGAARARHPGTDRPRLRLRHQAHRLARDREPGLRDS